MIINGRESHPPGSIADEIPRGLLIGKGACLERRPFTARSREPSPPRYSPGYFSKLFPLRNYAKLKTLKILCSSWTDIQSAEGQPYFIVSGYDLEELDRSVIIYIRQDPHYNYLSVRNLLTKDAIWQFQHIRSLPSRRMNMRRPSTPSSRWSPITSWRRRASATAIAPGRQQRYLFPLPPGGRSPGHFRPERQHRRYYLDELLQSP